VVAAEPNRRLVRIGIGVMYGFLVIASLAQVSALFVLGLAALLVVLWLKGFVRFRRLRRWSKNMWLGLVRLFHRRKPSRTQGITLITVVSSLVLAILLNQLRLAAPGEGRGLSVPLEMPSLQFSFGGVNSPGQWIATIISYGLLFGLTALVWVRLWRGIPHDEARWRMFAYWGAVALFLAMPFVFSLIMATMAPEVKPNDEVSAQANLRFSQNWLRFTTFVMASAFAFAALLPHIGPEPEIAPLPPPVSIEVSLAPPPGPSPTFSPAAARRK